MKQRPKIILSFVLILGFSLFIRVIFIRSVVDRDWPFSVFYYGDSEHFHLYAVSLMEGKLYDNGIPFHPPLYAWFLSGLYGILGVPSISGYPYKFWMAMLNAWTVAVTWFWWRKTIGIRWSWIGAVLLCFHFGWLLFSATFDNEVLYCLFLSATAGLLWIRAGSFSVRDAVPLGLLMGIGALTRGEHASLWPFLLFYLWIRRDKKIPFRQHLLCWTVAIVISFAVLIPTTIRNWRVLSSYNQQTSSLKPLPRFVPVTSYGAVNFALANCDTADGGFSPDLINKLNGGGGINLENQEHRRLYIDGYSIGMQWILKNPLRAFHLMLLKTNRWLDGYRLGFGVSNFPAGLSGERPPVDLFLPDHAFLKWPRVILLLIGICLSIRKENRAYSICSLILLHRLLTTLLFFGYARGLVVMLPVLIPLLLLPFIVAGRRRPAIEKVAGAAAILLVLFLTAQALEIAVRPPRNFNASGSSDNRGKIIQDDWVKIWPE